jgi:hypothetical protein
LKLYHAVILLLASAAALAQPYDAIVAGHDATCLAITPPIVHSYEWVGGPYLPNSDVFAIAPAPGGRVFAAVYPFPNFSVVELRPDGTRVPVTVPASGYPTAMVVDAAGAPYVLVNRAGGLAVVAFNSDGSLRGVHAIAAGFNETYALTALDLAADQCTLFILEKYTRVRRFDVCTGTALADFPLPLIEEYGALRVLPGGGLLVVLGDLVQRLDAAGTVVRTYDVGPQIAYALMLRDGGRRVVVGQQTECLGRLITLDLDTGAIVATQDLRLEQPSSIVTRGGWTAAIGATNPAAVPALGAAALAALAVMLAALALVRLR